MQNRIRFDIDTGKNIGLFDLGRTNKKLNHLFSKHYG